MTAPVIKPPQHPVGDLRKLVIVLDPKAKSKLQVSFTLPGTAPLPSPVNPLERWSSEGVLRRLKSDDAAGESTYGPLNYRTAARTLFLRPYLAHFCSFFRRFFAVLSVLTPGIQKVAPKDRGPVP